MVDKVIDLGVVAGEASHLRRQPRRGAEYSAIHPIRSVGDCDVFPKVAEEFDEGNVDALRPPLWPAGRAVMAWSLVYVVTRANAYAGRWVRTARA
jgi:hypothetical protein